MKPLVVYDTMIFLQAAMQESPRLHGTLQAVDSDQVRLCMSDELYDEIADVLTRNELRERAPSLTIGRVALLLAKIKSVAIWFNEVPIRFTLPDHRDDDHLFNLAIVGGGDFLVTWEKRILKLADMSSVAARELRSLAPRLAIVNPMDFMDELKRRVGS